MIELSFILNGKKVVSKNYPFARLLDVLRDDFGLTGVKEGCGEGECGACAIIMDNKLINSCLIPWAQVENCKITTIEGISDLEKDRVVKLQESFGKNNGVQCGICTPGMIVAGHLLLEKNPSPTVEEIKEALAGNLCRCTGYTKIIDSVLESGR